MATHCLGARGPRPVRGQAANRRETLKAAFASIDQTFRDFAVREHIPGAAWGIVIDGELAHVGVTGFRDVPSKAPVMPDTVFRIASMTKSFTAMAILKLRDEGKLSLDDPAERYVPELKELRYPTTRLAAHHDPPSAVACRRAFPKTTRGAISSSPTPTSEMSQMMRAGIPFSNAPGIAYEYSNYGFAILGRIVTQRVEDALSRLHREQRSSSRSA